MHCIWGNWTESWSTCNETCGDTGTQTKTRTKEQEAAGGGVACTGDGTKYQDCNRDPCPGKTKYCQRCVCCCFKYFNFYKNY